MSEFSELSSLSSILLAMGSEAPIDVAESILLLPIHRRPAAIASFIRKRAAAAARSATLRVKSARREFASIVIPKPTPRITRAAADHTLRLSSGFTDSPAMKAFLANGGSIEVLPTRNSVGFKRNKIRAGSGSTVTALHKSRAAHSRVAREIRSSRSSF